MTQPATQTVDEQLDPDVLARYQRAWAENDIDTIVAMTAPDGVYEASFGPEPWGQRFVGPEAIREALLGFRAAEPAGTRSTHEYDETWILGNRAFSRWTSTKTRPDGTTTTVQGADFFELRDGLVTKKLAYRKARE